MLFIFLFLSFLCFVLNIFRIRSIYVCIFIYLFSSLWTKPKCPNPSAQAQFSEGLMARFSLHHGCTSCFSSHLHVLTTEPPTCLSSHQSVSLTLHQRPLLQHTATLHCHSHLPSPCSHLHDQSRSSFSPLAMSYLLPASRMQAGGLLSFLSVNKIW